MQILVAGACGALIGLSFYLSSKIVDKYLKVLKDSQWRNFVIAIIGLVMVVVISVGLLSFLIP